MKKTILMALVLAFILAVEVANADFTFGEPVKVQASIPILELAESPQCVSYDGLEMYFESDDRPGGYGVHDIWVLRRDSIDEDWDSPVNLGPTVNGSGEVSCNPCISAGGLTLYFTSNRNRSGGHGDYDLYKTTRATQTSPWGQATNLGQQVNSQHLDSWPWISADGLELYFHSLRPGGYGGFDIYVCKRATANDPWGDAENLGPVVNTSYNDCSPCLSPDGLLLFIQDYLSLRPGGHGGGDLWVSRRASLLDPWGEAANLGPVINGPTPETGPRISPDGSTLYFCRASGGGIFPGWQASIDPVVDLNADGIVDSVDICFMVDFWGTDDPLCDIGPMPWGDGVVDVHDLIVLAEHLFEEIPPTQ